MSWLQVSIHTTKNHAETAENCLFTMGASTVTLTDAADQPILEPGVDETPIWNDVVITGLFENRFDQEELIAGITICLDSIKHRVSTEILEDKNWTRAWMENYHAMQFGDRLWVSPLHIDPPQPDATNLRLDPGLAFGTGTHPTTSLCLRWLDKNIYEQSRLLDYGCGSGILAIAACMLGINRADAVDIDPQALVATISNADINDVSEKINTWSVDDYAKHQEQLGEYMYYDIVMANILSGPLAELEPVLATHVKPYGHIVLSGILKEQAEHVSQTYQSHFKMDDPIYEGDWVLLHGIKT